MDAVYLSAIAQAGIIVGMTLAGFVCGLIANVEQVARWKPVLGKSTQGEERPVIVKFRRAGAGRME